MKFCYNTNSILPKQYQSSSSILQDGSRTFGLFWKGKKTPVFIPAKFHDLSVMLTNLKDSHDLTIVF